MYPNRTVEQLSHFDSLAKSNIEIRKQI